MLVSKWIQRCVTDLENGGVVRMDLPRVYQIQAESFAKSAWGSRHWWCGRHQLLKAEDLTEEARSQGHLVDRQRCWMNPTFKKNTGSLQREFHKFSGKSRLVIFFFVLKGCLQLDISLDVHHRSHTTTCAHSTMFAHANKFQLKYRNTHILYKEQCRIGRVWRIKWFLSQF